MGIGSTVCAALVCAAIVGCGSTTSADSEKIPQLEARVEAAESQVADAQSDAGTATSKGAADQDDVDAAHDDVSSKPAEEEATTDASSGDCIKVPNVVGKDHQLAQD